jgi:DNA-binding response OmpR family regulator
MIFSSLNNPAAGFFDDGKEPAFHKLRMKGSMKPNRTTASQTSDDLVLIVEDDEPTRELITGWLAAENIPCIGAASVAEAKRRLQSHKIAVTLLDWTLDKKGAGGAEVLAYCNEHHPLMAVIVMSGQLFDVRTDALIKQADGFLLKPFGGTVVVSHVRRWLKRLQAAPRINLPREEDKILPLDEIKGIYIRHVAQLLDNNATLAAKRLGIHRQTVTAVLKIEDAAGLN